MAINRREQLDEKLDVVKPVPAVVDIRARRKINRELSIQVDEVYFYDNEDDCYFLRSSYTRDGMTEWHVLCRDESPEDYFVENPDLWLKDMQDGNDAKFLDEYSL